MTLLAKANNTRQFRSSQDAERVPEGAELPKTIETVNKLIDTYNIFTKHISVQSNFDGYIAEDVAFAIGETVNIQHFLGVKPKWRIILRQVGNGVITDIPSGWNDKVISLKNNGAEAVIISVFIARE